jgi:hypothetical protein
VAALSTSQRTIERVRRCFVTEIVSDWHSI